MTGTTVKLQDTVKPARIQDLGHPREKERKEFEL
jgi:hypothetical protein